MSTQWTAEETNQWCECGRPHQSYCLEADCRFHATWPRPEAPLASMEGVPWMTTPQAERAASYRLQKAATMATMEQRLQPLPYVPPYVQLASK